MRPPSPRPLARPVLAGPRRDGPRRQRSLLCRPSDALARSQAYRLVLLRRRHGLGNPGSCVDSGSMIHLHPVTDASRGRSVPFDNAFNNIIRPSTPFYTAEMFRPIESKAKSRPVRLTGRTLMPGHLTYPVGSSSLPERACRGCFSTRTDVITSPRTSWQWDTSMSVIRKPLATVDPAIALDLRCPRFCSDASAECAAAVC